MPFNFDEIHLKTSSFDSNQLICKFGLIGVGAKSLTRHQQKPYLKNVTDCDVAFNIVFKDQFSHYTYQPSARHAVFIEKSTGNWDNIRVFDSTVEEIK